VTPGTAGAVVGVELPPVGGSGSEGMVVGTVGGTVTGGMVGRGTVVRGTVVRGTVVRGPLVRLVAPTTLPAADARASPGAAAATAARTAAPGGMLLDIGVSRSGPASAGPAPIPIATAASDRDSAPKNLILSPGVR